MTEVIGISLADSSDSSSGSSLLSASHLGIRGCVATSMGTRFLETRFPDQQYLYGRTCVSVFTPGTSSWKPIPKFIIEDAL
jgi:hypothetical protein